MGQENGDKTDLHLRDGRVAKAVAKAGDKKELEENVDIMKTVFEQMLKAGDQAEPLAAHYNNKKAVISPAKTPK